MNLLLIFRSTYHELSIASHATLSAAKDNGLGSGPSRLHNLKQRRETGQIGRGIRGRLPHQRVHARQGGRERPRGLLFQRRIDSAWMLGDGE